MKRLKMILLYCLAVLLFLNMTIRAVAEDDSNDASSTTSKPAKVENTESESDSESTNVPNDKSDESDQSNIAVSGKNESDDSKSFSNNDEGTSESENSASFATDSSEPEDANTEINDEETYMGITTSQMQTKTSFRMMLRAFNSSDAYIRGSIYQTYSGIDVSYAQGDIDWNAVAHSNVKFAIIKVAGRGYVNGRLYKDRYFDNNIREAKKYGIKVGVYFFTGAISEAEAIEEASYCHSLISGYSLDLPVYFDYEWGVDQNGNVYRTNNGASPTVRTSIADAFCRTMVSYGYSAGVYASGYPLSHSMDGVALAEKYRLWAASYGSKVTYYKGPYDMWQYSSTGSVNGINGAVDMDYWYQGYDTWPTSEDKGANAFVKRLYENCLRREPDAIGLVSWTNVLTNHSSTASSVVESFFTSSEYTAKNRSNEDFVKDAYQTILDRLPEASGLSSWSGALDVGTSRKFVLFGLTSSAEFASLCNNYGIVQGKIALTESRDMNYNVTAFVSRAYNLILSRKADTSGLNNWCGAMNNGTITATALMQGFVNSKEFLLRYVSDKEYIRICYQVLLDREPESSGMNGWLNVLNNGVSHDYLLEQIANSPEFNRICLKYCITRGDVTLSQNRDQNYGITSFIARCYRTVLNRDYDVTGINNWTGALLHSPNIRSSVNDVTKSGFFHSREFQQRNVSNGQYVKILYQTFLNRSAEKSGYENWLNALNNGASRDVILESFADSAEFSNLLSSYGV